jgi:cytochrome c-type biogenesis protein CcmH
MAEAARTSRRVAPATIALAAAGLLAVGAVGIAVFRPGNEIEQPQTNSVGAQPQAQSVDQMIASLETRLRANPDNPADWRTLGWSYFELGREADSDGDFRMAMARSSAAYRRAAELEPGNAENWSSLGEALQVTMTQVAPEAEQAFQRAIRLNPADPRARYFLAVQKDLRGQHAQAIDDWLALLRDTPAGAPWEADLRRTIEQTASRHRIDLGGRLPPPRPAASTASAAIPGPTREQMAAASSIPPGQQDQMVRGMVDGLAARLHRNPRDADGWIRLMRSRMVLREPDAAAGALRSALAAFPNDAATQNRLRGAARELAVPGA